MQEIYFYLKLKSFRNDSTQGNSELQAKIPTSPFYI